MKPRSYPSELGTCVHKIYEAELQSPARGPLRLRVDVDWDEDEVVLFSQLPTGDTWEDAGMPEVFLYLYHCKHVRRGLVFHNIYILNEGI